MVPAVQTKGLSKTYGKEIHALAALDLDIAVGEIFGLLGPNGAGKTTLVKLLLGLVKPSSGSAQLLGQPIQDAAARYRVGYLPENHRFPSYLTATQLLDYYARLADVSAENRKARIPELLDQVNLAKWANQRVGKFSKGMLQRIGLAQAMMSKPEILFLDEPTDGVDPIGRREIRDLLEKLSNEGVTIFLNSHLLSEVERLCTRVAILNNGQLIRQGTIKELTQTKNAYAIVSAELGKSVLAELGSAISNYGCNEGMASWTLAVENTTELNGWIDRLRGDRIEFSSIQPVSTSLEDFFIHVIDGKSVVSR